MLSSHTEIYAFEQAGHSLLMRDFGLYEKYRESFSYSSYVLSNKEKDLDSIYLSLKNYKRKSPFLSACLSALVPGLGKIYAGSLGGSKFFCYCWFFCCTNNRKLDKTWLQKLENNTLWHNRKYFLHRKYLWFIYKCKTK